MAQALHRTSEHWRKEGVLSGLALHVGPNPTGPRGGRSGDSVEATVVARGDFARWLYWMEIDDEMLLNARFRLGRELTADDFPKGSPPHILQVHAILLTLGK